MCANRHLSHRIRFRKETDPFLPKVYLRIGRSTVSRRKRVYHTILPSQHFDRRQNRQETISIACDARQRRARAHESFTDPPTIPSVIYSFMPTRTASLSTVCLPRLPHWPLRTLTCTLSRKSRGDHISHQCFVNYTA